MEDHVDLKPTVTTELGDCSINYERQCDDEEPCKYHDTRPQFYSAAIYFVDQNFGGPEEGGWWYTAGEPVLREAEMAILARNFRTAGEAYGYAQRVLQPICDKRNKGRRPISSVASEGEYTPHVTRGLPVAFPEFRPHYE